MHCERALKACVDLVERDHLLGDLLSTTSRRAGKTLLAIATGIHMAAGHDFMDWKGHREARVLYIDGEMKTLRDEVNRSGLTPDGFHILSHDPHSSQLAVRSRA